MANLLSAQSIAKSFATTQLFHGVTLHLEEDERLGIIGPNGSGKSTLLKILAGLENADEGDVTTKRGLRIWYVPQIEEFADEQTPLEIVLGSIGEDSTGAEVIATKALSRLGFEQFDQPFRQLSGGWQKRISIACGLVHDPEVLLLDEPTNHLDRATRVRLIEALAGYDGTVICASHDPGIVDGIATHVFEVKEGEATEILSMRKIDSISDDGPKTARQRREAKEAREAANTR